MRIIVNYHKGEELRFISHLDVQRLMQRAMRRADIPLGYSQGFNPHPLISFASALAVGYTSDGEWMDVRLSEDMEPQVFLAALNAGLPLGMRVYDAKAAPEDMPTLTALTHSSLYRAALYLDPTIERAKLEAGISELLSGPIVVAKHTKSGMRQVDIAPQVLAVTLLPGEEQVLQVLGVFNVNGALNMELFLQSLLTKLGVGGSARVHRDSMFFENNSLLPQYVQ